MDQNERIEIALTQKPELSKYYYEDLLNVYEVVEVTSRSGEVHYDINYTFPYLNVTDYSEQMSILQANFPELYNLFRNGSIIINNVSKYVDEEGGIRYNVNYRYTHQ